MRSFFLFTLTSFRYHWKKTSTFFSPIWTTSFSYNEKFLSSIYSHVINHRNATDPILKFLDLLDIRRYIYIPIWERSIRSSSFSSRSNRSTGRNWTNQAKMEHVILPRIYLFQQRWIIKINLKRFRSIIRTNWLDSEVNLFSIVRFFLTFKVFSRRSRGLNEGDPGIEWQNEGKRMLKDVKREIDEA